MEPAVTTVTTAPPEPTMACKWTKSRLFVYKLLSHEA